MKLTFKPSPKPDGTAIADWQSWHWQLRSALTTRDDFAKRFTLSEEELKGFAQADGVFQIRTTPYYASLAQNSEHDPIRRIFMPTGAEGTTVHQAMLDPLGEKRNLRAPRVVHRYPDRVLFLVTDTCSVYCRYCTRKHFTATDQAFIKSTEYTQALDYIRSKPGIREVILSGGDPLTLADGVLDRVLCDLRSIDHIEIIRIGSRMPVVCPMRITSELVSMIKKHQPVFLLTHFNHPRELTEEAALALARAVDAGIPVLNQLVLLNGVNNHAAIIQALNRRLLFLRVKPYYMFQCDPSEGTDHLRTSIEQSLQIQRELWGKLSGLAMSSLSVDIPDGGGKVTLVPDFQIAQTGDRRTFKGWDGVQADYVSPPLGEMKLPLDFENYLSEWHDLGK